MRRFLPGLHFFFLLGSNGRLDEGAGGGVVDMVMSRQEWV